MIYTSSIRNKFGWFTLSATDTHLISCNWTDTQIINQNTSSLILKEAITQLSAYFNGRLKVFDLTILTIGTPFQKKVWEELCNIPYGETVSYKEIAIAIGQDNSYRAVGSANGKNPLHIIVPCHRVICSDGSIGGYGAGIDNKQRLLSLEAIK